MIYADIFVNMNTADADATPLTSTIMNAGTKGVNSGWAMRPTSPPAGMTIESPASAALKRYDTIVLPLSTGGAYGPSAPTRTIKYLHTSPNSGTDVEIGFTGLTTRAATCFGLIQIGPANAGPSSGLFDLVHFIAAFSGNFAVMQLNNGAGVTPGDNFLAIETNPGGVTTHSLGIRVIPGGIYWFNLKCDFGWRPGMTAGTTPAVSGFAELALFHPYTGQCLGYRCSPTRKITATADFVDVISACQIGNGEAGTSAGAITFFKHVGFDTRWAKFPILPKPSSQLGFGMGWPSTAPIVYTPIRRGNRLRRRFIAQED